MANLTQTYGTPVALTVTNLQSLAKYQSTDYAWLSARVDLTGVNCLDVLINVHLTTANTAPANDKGVSIFIIPWYKDAAAAWRPSDLGTTTAPVATEGKGVVITNTNGVNAPMLGFLCYNTATQALDGTFSLKSIFNSMPSLKLWRKYDHPCFFGFQMSF